MSWRAWPVAALLALAPVVSVVGDGRAGPLGDLPLVELPARGQGDLLAIVWSGDGGWADLANAIGESLATRGVAVVGVDTLRYFWEEKTPDQVGGDLAAIIAHYGAAWDRPKVVLVGYSFGADVLPFAYNRLPVADRARVVQLSLLARSTIADFEFHLVGWVSEERHAGSLDTAPELARLGDVRLQCFYGTEESDTTGCLLPEVRPDQRIAIEGGHHFDGDYEAIARRIQAAAEGAG